MTHSPSSEKSSGTFNVIAGPWRGEFGHELFAWQGYLRRWKDENPEAHLTVWCGKGKELLYKDFSDAIITEEHTCGKENMWQCEGCKPKHPYGYDKWIHPYKGHVQYLPGKLDKNTEKQRFIQFGTPKKRQIVAIHARDTRKLATGSRNWEHWEELDIGRPTAIGRTDQAKCPEYAIDARGLELWELADVLAGTKVLIGPSSGAMHFGALCGTPLVVWGKPSDRVRYERDWNPFNVPVAFIPKWQPEVDEVLKNIHNML